MAKKKGLPPEAPQEPTPEVAPPPVTPQTSQGEKPKPVYARRYSISGGEYLELAVFSYLVDNGNNPFQTFSTGLKRCYKDSDGKWQDSKFLTTFALPVASVALSAAFLWISEQRNGNGQH